MIGEKDNLEFENVTDCLKYFLNQILQKESLESKNVVNVNTYKNKIYEITHKFFSINNPRKSIFNEESPFVVWGDGNAVRDFKY